MGTVIKVLGQVEKKKHWSPQHVDYGSASLYVLQKLAKMDRFASAGNVGSSSPTMKGAQYNDQLDEYYRKIVE